MFKTRSESTVHIQGTNDNIVWTKSRNIQVSGGGGNWEKAASQVMGEAWQSAKLRSLNFISKHWGATKGF